MNGFEIYSAIWFGIYGVVIIAMLGYAALKGIG